jgi:uncharacterized membrane protein YheB (UPF0754 family)
MNKSLLTTLISIALIFVGLFSPIGGNLILYIGLFATSGAITNWLAIHMLFEKVPGIYGSGIIPLKFDEFRKAIKNMTMTQFFSEENFKKFINQPENSSLFDAEKLIGLVDYDLFFRKLVETVTESNLGSMLMMVGGSAALEPLKPAFQTKMEEGLREFLNSDQLKSQMLSGSGEGQDFSQIKISIEKMIDDRLLELTPEMVKEIIHQMIHNHLGWLVIWGGVFGGAIGAFSVLII